MARRRSVVNPCELGDELLPWTVTIASTSAVDLTLYVCFANARIRAWVQEDPMGTALLLVDESNKSKVQVRLPELPPGRYQVFWSIQTPASKWQTKAELTVDDVVRYRQKKASDGNNPVNSGSLGLKVQG